MIKILDEKIYFDAIKRFDEVPYSQSLSWFNYLKVKGEKLVMFLDSEIDPQFAFFGREINIPIFSNKILLIETPLINNQLNDKSITKRLKELIDFKYTGFEIDSAVEYNTDFEIGLRRAGFLRPLGYLKCPLSIKFNLKEDFNYDKNWKNSMKKASNSQLYADEILNPSFDHAEIFCSLFEEMKTLKKLKYSLQPKNIMQLFNNEEFRLFFCYRDKKVISAGIIYSTEYFGFDIFRANGPDSRNYSASHFLYDYILLKLKDEGKEFFDFGRIPPSSHETDSVYVFKKGSGGRKIQYNGEWAYYKKPFFEYLKHFAMLYLRKNVRY